MASEIGSSGSTNRNTANTGILRYWCRSCWNGDSNRCHISGDITATNGSFSGNSVGGVPYEDVTI